MCGEAKGHYGAISLPLGELVFAQAYLVVNLTLTNKQAIEQNMIRILNLSVRILQGIRMISHKLSWLSQLRLYRSAKRTTFYFFLVFQKTDHEFRQRLNLGSIKTMRARWRRACIYSIFGNRSQEALEVLGQGKSQSQEKPSEADAFSELAGRVSSFYDAEVKGKRRKRGLFDLGGKALSGIFGLVTEDELKEREVKFQKAEKEMEVELKEAIQIVEETLVHMESVQVRLVDEIKHLMEYEQVSSINEQLGHVNDLLRFIYSMHKEGEEQQTLLSNNMMPEILNIQELESLIEEGKTKFDNMEFPVETLVTREHLLKAMRLITVQKTGNTHSFLLALPFIAKSSPSQLYALEGFPTSSKGMTVLVDNIRNYVSIDEDSYEELDNLKGCVRNVDRIVCPGVRKRKKGHQQSCAVGIVRREREVIRTHCHYRRIEENLYAIGVKENWVIFAQNKTVATITCPESSTQKLIEFVHTLCIPITCSLETKHEKLGSVQRGYTDKKQKVLEFPAEGITDITILDDDNSMLSNLSVKLSEDIRRLHEKQLKDKVGHTIINISVMGGTLAIIIMGIIIAVCIIGRKVKNSKTSMAGTRAGVDRERNQTEVQPLRQTPPVPPPLASPVPSLHTVRTIPSPPVRIISPCTSNVSIPLCGTPAIPRMAAMRTFVKPQTEVQYDDIRDPVSGLDESSYMTMSGERTGDSEHSI